MLLALPALAGFVGAGVGAVPVGRPVRRASPASSSCGAPLRPRDSQPADPRVPAPAHRDRLGGARSSPRFTSAACCSPTTPSSSISSPRPRSISSRASRRRSCCSCSCCSRTAPLRRRLWKSHRGFQASHVILACVLAALVAVHVVVTARYLGGARTARVCTSRPRSARSSCCCAHAARRQTSRQSAAPPTRVRAAFDPHRGRASRSAPRGSPALVPASVDAALREPLIRRTSRLALDFPHDKHGAVNCLTCHHNYADGTGAALCVECHRSQRTDLHEGAEARVSRILLRVPSASERRSQGDARARRRLPGLPPAARSQAHRVRTAVGRRRSRARR